MIAARTEERAIEIRATMLHGMTVDEYWRIQQPDVKLADSVADAGLVCWEDAGDGISPKATLMDKWCGGQ